MLGMINGYYYRVLDVKRLVREYYEYFYVNSFDNCNGLNVWVFIKFIC